MKGRIAAWEDRHRTAVVRGSLVALLLVAAVVLFLVLRGGAGPAPCAMYQKASQVYLVLHPRAGTGWERRDCGRLAEGFSLGSGGRLRVVTAKSDYGSNRAVCSLRGAGGEFDIYAKRRSPLFARALCSVLNPTGGAATEVVRLASPARARIYYVLSGPSSVAIKLIAQRLVSRSSKKNGHIAVVPKPDGRKGCTFHRGPFSLSIYSPSRHVAASICDALRPTSLL